MKDLKVAVIGTGMIGTSMAVLATGHGLKTTMLAVNEELKQKSEAQFDAFYQQLKDNELLNDKQIAYCKNNLNYTFNYEDLKDVDVVFECVIEDINVKHEVYKSLEDNCPNIKAIASVSSALVTDELAKSATKYKDRILVAHPFFPPHLVPYFEMATGKDTSEEAVKFVKVFLEFLDRKPVVLKKPAPGFIGNRLQFALWREALNIVDEGIAEPEDVDTCLMYSFCARYTSIGMYEHFDNGGLKLNYNVCQTVFPTLSNIKKAPKSITERIERGDLGRPTGKGFYDWTKKDTEDFDKRVAKPFLGYFNWEVPEE